jgi:alpha-D-ribose 1-methylphosphonate 5-triphosphate synthase subunit PhnL
MHPQAPLNLPKYRVPTGELLKSLRPATYRQVVDLLAEPREHVSYREIARVCKVGGSTIKAIERAEAESVAEAKARLLRKATRVADRAWSTVEDKLETANLAQATICAGIATEKMILLGGEPMQRIDVNISAPNIIEHMQALHAQIVEACAQLPDPPTLEAEVVSCALVAGDQAAVDGFDGARASQ